MSRSSRAGAVLTIDLGAVARNYRTLRDRLKGAACAAVVKADAYGLGAKRIVRELAAAGCDTFFVATLSEAQGLRRALEAREPFRIFVLNGALPGREPDFVAAGLVPVLNTPEQISDWGALARARKTRLAAALHLDTGMSRLGLGGAETEALAASPTALEDIDVALVLSHLACADEPAHEMNALQLARFDRLRRWLPAAPASLANSSGIFLGPDYELDLVRAGVALYGANPCPGHPNPMAEVVHLQAKIVQVRYVDSPMTVGYGAAHRVVRPGRIATVPVGYADGWPRALSHRGAAYIAGIQVPLVGRVSMDLTTFDVTSVPEHLSRPGCAVELIGANAPIDEVAGAAGTIAYEILTRLGGRYRRVFVGGRT